MATVVVLTPPAVPIGEPPMNMRTILTIAELSEKSACGIVSNPAVLVVTD